MQCNPEERNGYEQLLQRAVEARKLAYAPYSGYCVGAALLTGNGKIYSGCNIENAAFSPTNCAERTAFFKAISEGVRDFEAIAVVGGKAGAQPDELCPPCGVCRQVMMEFCDHKNFRIVLQDAAQGIKVMTLEELLPVGFGGAQII